VIAYEVQIKLNSGGGRVSRDSDSSDKGKWIIDTKDPGSRRVCRRILKQVLEINLGVVEFTFALVSEGGLVPIISNWMVPTENLK